MSSVPDEVPSSKPEDGTIGERLKAERARLGKSQKEMAAETGIPLDTYTKYEGNARVPGGEALASLARAGLDVNALLIGGAPGRGSAGIPGAALVAGDFLMVPRYDVHGSAGNGSLVHSEQVVDYLAFRADWVRNALGVAHKDLVLISVKGDSMEPTLSNGDLILVDISEQRVEDSAIYVLKNLDRLLVKRLQHKLDGTVVVKCDNQRYDSETYEAGAASALMVVGRVVWAGRKL